MSVSPTLLVIFIVVALLLTVVTLLKNNKEDANQQKQDSRFVQPIYRFFENQLQYSIDGGNTWKAVTPCIGPNSGRRKNYRKSTRIKIKLGPNILPSQNSSPRGQEIGERVRHRISQGQSVRRRTI